MFVFRKLPSRWTSPTPVSRAASACWAEQPGCPRQPLQRWGPSPLLERPQNQQMVAASPGGRRGDRPASTSPRASPLLAEDPAGVLERAFPAGGRDRGVVLARAGPEQRQQGPA